MSEQRWLVDTEPSARLPIYTRLNASDVLSDPITPLGADLGWIQNILPGWNAGYAFHGSYSLVEKPDVAARTAGSARTRRSRYTRSGLTRATAPTVAAVMIPSPIP